MTQDTKNKRGPRRKNKPGAGRPEHKPTPEQRRRIAELARVGVSQENISKIEQISVEALVKHYAVELQVELQKNVGRLLNTAWKKALEDEDWKAIEFLLKHFAGLSDKPAESTVNVNVTVDRSELMDRAKQLQSQFQKTNSTVNGATSRARH
jgi:hypothetical protein